MIGYTQGRFDVVHHGHVTSLSMMKRFLGLGGQLVVGVATDEFCREWTGKDPVLNWHERATVIRHLDVVDVTIPYSGYPDGVFAKVGFDVFFCTEELYEKERSYYAAKPWRTVFFPRTPGVSSSLVKSKMGVSDG